MGNKLLTFYVGESLCGIDIAQVKEITRKVEYTEVIAEDDRLIGLMNLRGQVVTLVDLAKMAELPLQERRETYCVVLKEDKKRQDAAGFFADNLGEVLEIESGLRKMPPLREGRTQLAEYVVQREKDLILVFDVYKLLNKA